jgi:hypothetical protein
MEGGMAELGLSSNVFLGIPLFICKYKYAEPYLPVLCREEIGLGSGEKGNVQLLGLGMK